MKNGGEYIGQGADTCVYDPPLKCIGRPEYPSHKYVSRVMPEPGESEIQYKIKEVIRKYETAHPGKVSKYFNLMIDACSIFEVKDTDVRNSKSGKKCSHHEELKQPGIIDAGYENVITPKQTETVIIRDTDGQTKLYKSAPETAKALYGLLMALVYCRGEFVHADAHGKNIAWMPEGHIVLFDWGRAATTTEQLERLINSVLGASDEYAPLTQFTFIVDALSYTEDPATLSVVWDILAMFGLMDSFDILPIDAITNACGQIYDIIVTRAPTLAEMAAIINNLYRASGMGMVVPYTTRRLVPLRDMGSPASSTSSSSSSASMEKREFPPVKIDIKPKGVKLFPFGLPKGGVKQSTKFCRCIKAVRKTIKARPGSTKESGAIAVCNVSILGRRGRTLKKFRCGKKPYLKTQKKIIR
jgi:hypothetical protein